MPPCLPSYPALRPAVFTTRTAAAARAGFTLVEVLAALLFLAVLVPTILGALALSNRTAVLAERGALAAELAENKLNEFVVDGSWSTSSGTSGDFGDGWPGYRWEMNAATWQGGGTAGTAPAGGSSSTGAATGTIGTTGSTAMTQVDVDVIFQVQGQERRVRLSTLVSTTLDDAVRAAANGSTTSTSTGTGTTGTGTGTGTVTGTSTGTSGGGGRP